MPDVGDRPGCCLDGHLEIRRMAAGASPDGWTIELHWREVGRPVRVSHCPWCGAWLAGLAVEGAAGEVGEATQGRIT